eukprot:768475-Hanusia_phi.AAC.14
MALRTRLVLTWISSAVARTSGRERQVQLAMGIESIFYLECAEPCILSLGVIQRKLQQGQETVPVAAAWGFSQVSAEQVQNGCIQTLHPRVAFRMEFGRMADLDSQGHKELLTERRGQVGAVVADDCSW